MTFLRQSTAANIGMGPFVDSLDGNSVEGSLTITQPDIRLKKNGDNWIQKNAAQTLSHEENGWYEVALDATDTDTLGILIVAIHEGGALPVWREFMVLPANVYDSLFSTDKLEVDIAQFGGTNGTFASGRPEVNTSHLSGTLQTARDIGASVLIANPQGFRKNTAFSNFQFAMFDSNGDLITGRTVTAQRAIDNGAFAACANSVTEMSLGFYRIDLAATDLNGDIITFLFTATGAKPTAVTIRTVVQ